MSEIKCHAEWSRYFTVEGLFFTQKHVSARVFCTSTLGHAGNHKGVIGGYPRGAWIEW